ncbi:MULTISPECIES: right-handed parallel beta-helix repeat-containing protein [unclassified Microcoleus]|uniref:right-handed parallel beta-helix repeat-containing protein n=1 Tax=unclassified Microcoleus TaxID=2642155 RepID=UPI002FD6857D
MGGVENFEVAYNLVKDGKKEGIDVKEKSKYGTVHHNYIYHMARQGLYVDSWFGVLEDVEVFNNVVHDCKGAGFALAVEGGAEAKNIRFHHNLIYDNWGTGILFARWGNDGLRHNIKIYNNTVHHNGYGKPNPGDSFFWITGGLYLFSDNFQNVEIKNNIFSKNRGFQIGYSDRYLAANSDIEKIFRQKDIEISQNLIFFGENNTIRPIYAGWLPDNYANIYGTSGTAAVREEPQFVNPEEGNFYLKSPVSNPTSLTANYNTSQMRVGAFPHGEKPHFWW